MLKPYYQHNGITIYNGNSLHVLAELPAASVSCLLTDPPYSSGGCFRSDRQRATGDKYTLSGTAINRPDFSGDNRDQRSWTFWCTWWLSVCAPLLQPGAHVFSFIDWRQLPSLTDAMQAAGFVWRGIIPWNKTGAARPQKGWFRAQCEYVLTASVGTLGQEQQREGPCMEGFWTQSAGQDKHHQTGKPVALCRFLLEPSSTGIVLDPFMGGGSTLFAAREAGRPAIGIEIEEAICEDAAKRLEQEVLPLEYKVTNQTDTLI